MELVMKNCESRKNDVCEGKEMFFCSRQQASSDDYLLDMTPNQVEDILISLGWEKLLRKDHLMLFRKYEDDLEVYSYKSKTKYFLLRIYFFFSFRHI